MIEQDNKRRHTRFPLLLHVEYSKGSDFFSEWTENLSEGGLFVRTDQQFESGNHIELSLSFPGLIAPVLVKGRVAWIRPATAFTPAGVGVEIDNESSRRRLADLALRATGKSDVGLPRPFSVLVVEDNIRVVRSYERVLQHFADTAGDQVKIHFAADGQAALTLLKKHSINLLMTDIYMPVMDGFALVENIRQSDEYSDLAIVIITGGRADERERAAKLGVRAFLNKPVQFSQILQTIVSLAAGKGEDQSDS